MHTDRTIAIERRTAFPLGCGARGNSLAEKHWNPTEALEVIRLFCVRYNAERYWYHLLHEAPL